jgi:hypothetical protein
VAMALAGPNSDRSRPHKNGALKHDKIDRQGMMYLKFILKISSIIIFEILFTDIYFIFSNNHCKSDNYIVISKQRWSIIS